MIGWKFGTIVGARQWPSVRLMLVAETNTVSIREGRAQDWWAIILRDDEDYDRWTPGDRITLSPDDPDVTIIEWETE